MHSSYKPTYHQYHYDNGFEQGTTGSQMSNIAVDELIEPESARNGNEEQRELNGN